MKLYFYDGELTDELISYMKMSYKDVVVIDAKVGYTKSLRQCNLTALNDFESQVLTNCVHLLNNSACWESSENKTVNPEVYIYNDRINGFVRANDYKRIRKTNNIETMYRNGDFDRD